MASGKLSTSQDGVQARTKTAGNVLPPFTTSDLYGTCPERLHQLKEREKEFSELMYSIGLFREWADHLSNHFQLAKRLRELQAVPQ